MRARALTLILTSLVTGVACSGDGTTKVEPSDVPGIHFVNGAGAQDTAGAVLTQALVIRVIGNDGKPLADATVVFTPTEVPVVANPTPPPRATTQVSSITSSVWSTRFSSRTDESGRAQTLVRLSTVAGPAGVVVDVPALGRSDTATFLIMPGQATQLVMAPRDTAVFVGGTLSLRATTLDRYRNPRTDPIAYTLSSTRAVMSGSTLSAIASGRLRVFAHAGTFDDSGDVSVVPRGTAAVYAGLDNSLQTVTLCVVDLDGGNLRWLVPSALYAGYNGEMPSSWARDGKSIVYHDNKGNHTRALWTVDAATGVTRHLPSASASLGHEAWPVVSRDGAWVYYQGTGFQDATLYRITIDGTIREDIGPNTVVQLFPWPSPDLTRVVSLDESYMLQVMDVASRKITPLGQRSAQPAWSPVTDQIAFVRMEAYPNSIAGGVFLMRPDGSGLRALTSNADYSGRLDWSPDGKYLIATRLGRLNVIDVATGEEMPIHIDMFGRPLMAPSWKP